MDYETIYVIGTYHNTYYLDFKTLFTFTVTTRCHSLLQNHLNHQIKKLVAGIIS